MRPRKRVLLFCLDDDIRGVWAWVLRIHGFKVAATIEDGRPDVAVFIYDTKLESENYARLVDQTCGHDVPMLVLVKTEHRSDCNYPARALKIAFDPRPSDFLKIVKTFAARKRGPKKPQHSLEISHVG